MKKLILFCLCIISMGLQAQNSSFGITTSGMSYNNTQGYQLSANVRTQYSQRLGWSTELSYGKIGPTITITETISRTNFSGHVITEEISTTKKDQYMSIKTGLAYKVLDIGNIALETIISGGLLRNNKDYFGLLSSEIFISTPLSNRTVAGITGGCSFVTWEREWFCTAGVSLRYHL